MARPKALQHVRATDLRGVVQLATQATRGVARISEGVHQAVWSSLGAPGGATTGSTRGLTGLVYQTVQSVAQLVGTGTEALLARLEPLLASADASTPDTPQREAVLAALNGVLGDRLAASGNPLATRMQLRHAEQRLDWTRAATLPSAASVGGKLLVVIHGLCMNDLQWTHTTADGEVRNHASTLAALGYTPVYVRYNTGLHTSDNGAALAAELDQLVAHWPVTVDEITVLAHSMGGLVTRSAVLQTSPTAPWRQRLKNIVFLGTPHHGAPLERAGNWIDVLLGATPFSRPFAKLGQLRSAGITDLRYGFVSPSDWRGRNRFDHGPDRRAVAPLPEGVNCYSLAATTARRRSALADRLLGDGLVPLRSALGLHDDSRRTLAFDKTRQCIAYQMNHMELLHRPEVGKQLVAWLCPSPTIGQI